MDSARYLSLMAAKSITSSFFFFFFFDLPFLSLVPAPAGMSNIEACDTLLPGWVFLKKLMHDARQPLCSAAATQ